MGIMRWVGLGCGVGLREQNPVGGSDGSADLSPAGQLLRTAYIIILRNERKECIKTT